MLISTKIPNPVFVDRSSGHPFIKTHENASNNRINLSRSASQLIKSEILLIPNTIEENTIILFVNNLLQMRIYLYILCFCKLTFEHAVLHPV